MIAPHRLRRFFLTADVRLKLRALRAAKRIRRGGLLAHHTSTLAGVAAIPTLPTSILKLIQFKQRPGPFVVLADSQRTALNLARYLTPELRRLSRACWPSSTTLIYPARKNIPSTLLYRGNIAVRVDADKACRQLNRACGGLLLSSSLNRKGDEVQAPSLHLQMHWHRHLTGRISSQNRGSGQASTLLKVTRSGVKKLR